MRQLRCETLVIEVDGFAGETLAELCCKLPYSRLVLTGLSVGLYGEPQNHSLNLFVLEIVVEKTEQLVRRYGT